MFIPLGDDNPREKPAYVTWGLIGLNIALFFLWCFPNERLDRMIPSLALYPEQKNWADPAFLKTLFTSMFMHAGLLHLIGNMLFLWIFGDNVEDKMGHVPFAIFYLLCGVAADVLHIVTTSTPEIPTLGASGAVSGMLGAYVIFFPQQKIRMLIFLFYFVTTVQVPAYAWIGIWFLEQIWMSSMKTNVAHFAHIGGFILGLLGAIFWKYLLVPNRFGLASPGRVLPAEILSSSRTSNRRRALDKPLVTVDDGIRFVDDEVAESFAVLRAGADLDDIRTIGSVVAPILKESPDAVRDRLTRTRGTIARNVPKDVAERLRWSLHKVGVPTIVAPRTGATALPPRITPVRVMWDERGIVYAVGGNLNRVDWVSPFLVLGAKVDGIAVIDVFLSNRVVLHLNPDVPMERLSAGRTETRTATLDQFANDLVRFRQGTAVNEGVRILANRGSWGWLAFIDPQDYEDYAFWAYNIVLARRPVFRF